MQPRSHYWTVALYSIEPIFFVVGEIWYFMLFSAQLICHGQLRLAAPLNLLAEVKAISRVRIFRKSYLYSYPSNLSYLLYLNYNGLIHPQGTEITQFALLWVHLFRAAGIKRTQTESTGLLALSSGVCVCVCVCVCVACCQSGR